jgi:hypothetical protein
MACSLPKNTAKEISDAKESFFAGLSLVTNTLSSVTSSSKLCEIKIAGLDKRVEELNDSVKYVYSVLEQMLNLLKNSKVILHCSNEQKGEGSEFGRCNGFGRCDELGHCNEFGGGGDSEE